MQAYEFYATPENGTIKLPEQLKNRITSGVKVILLEYRLKGLGLEEKRIKKRTDSLSPVSIDTRGWVFDKDEANER
ncbi:MAG: hypothetical protein FWE90_06300 [Defluviitaleaceae bacterium]|nr:hypothetical protein [Defluviitaleaceae bacterium]